MVAAPRALPDLIQLDPTALKALILSQHEQLLSRDNEIEHLKLLIAKLRRMQFGRKSEKLDRQIEQLELRRHVLSATKLHADDTPVPALAPGDGKTKTGRLWTYVRDDRPAGDITPAAVWFAYSPDRKGEHPQAHLGHFTDTLQADGYAGFDPVYETGRIQEAACWAHVRRKFCHLHVAHKSPVAAEAIERIAALYAIEKEIRGHAAGERRRAATRKRDRCRTR